MNSTPALLVSTFSVGFGAVAAFFALQDVPVVPDAEERSRTEGAADPASDLQVAIDGLRSSLEALEGEVGLLRSGSSPRPPSTRQHWLAPSPSISSSWAWRPARRWDGQGGAPRFGGGDRSSPRKR